MGLKAGQVKRYIQHFLSILHQCPLWIAQSYGSSPNYGVSQKEAALQVRENTMWCGSSTRIHRTMVVCDLGAILHLWP